MGESKKDALRVNFDRKLELEFHGMKVTSDAGLIAYREIDDVFGLMDMVACELRDKKNLLIVQGEFGKIIGVVRRKVCFLTVYPIRGALYLCEVEMVYKYMLI